MFGYMLFLGTVTKQMDVMYALLTEHFCKFMILVHIV